MTTSLVTRKKPSLNNPRGLLIVAIVVIMVIIAAIIAIALTGSSAAVGLNFASLPQSRLPDGGFVVGNPQAPITIVEFSDYDCPICQGYRTDMEHFLTDYLMTGKAKFEFRILPTHGGQLSYYTGQLVECAEDQKPGSFWKGYSLMYSYATSGRYTPDIGRQFASDAGLNYGNLLSCTASAKQVQTDIDLGTKSGITGTPAVMVRYGDGAAQFITYNNHTYNSGGVPYPVLAAITEAVQG